MTLAPPQARRHPTPPPGGALAPPAATLTVARRCRVLPGQATVQHDPNERRHHPETRMDLDTLAKLGELIGGVVRRRIAGHTWRTRCGRTRGPCGRRTTPGCSIGCRRCRRSSARTRSSTTCSWWEPRTRRDFRERSGFASRGRSTSFSVRASSCIHQSRGNGSLPPAVWARWEADDRVVALAPGDACVVGGEARAARG